MAVSIAVESPLTDEVRALIAELNTVLLALTPPEHCYHMTVEQMAGPETAVFIAREEGRDPARIGSALYHNININEDRQSALEESKAFLDTYYTAKFSPAFVEGWTVAGSPKQCIALLKAYFDAGVGHMALRLTSWDQRGQLARFLGEVAPALQASR